MKKFSIITKLLPWRIRMFLGESGPLGELTWNELQYDQFDRKRLMICSADRRGPMGNNGSVLHWLTREFLDPSIEKSYQIDLAKRLMKSPYLPFFSSIVLSLGWTVVQYGIYHPDYPSLTLVRLFLVEPISWLFVIAIIQLVFHTVLFVGSESYVENFFVCQYWYANISSSITAAWLYSTRDIFDFVAWPINEGYTMAFILVCITVLFNVRFFFLVLVCVWTAVITLIFRYTIPDEDDGITSHIPFQQWLAIIAGLAIVLAGKYLMETHSRVDFFLCRNLLHESQRSDKLLRSILPDQVIQHLKNFEFTIDQRRGSQMTQYGSVGIAEAYDKVTILFTDVVSFTTFSSHISPEELVLFLNELFTCFDDIAEECGLEKIKTIGDAYMGVSGLPNPNPMHAVAAARMGLRIVELMKSALFKDHNGDPLGCRVGIHSGSVVAGVIGRKKFIYDIWGDAVNTASRMESTGEVNMVHCSETTAVLLQEQSGNSFLLQPRGVIDVKGKGAMNTCWIIGEQQSDDERGGLSSEPSMVTSAEVR
jgi:class 3 adenylate cyclase